MKDTFFFKTKEDDFVRGEEGVMIMIYLALTHSQTDKFRICTSCMEAGILAIYSLKFICACKKLLRYARVTRVQFEDF